MSATPGTITLAALKWRLAIAHYQDAGDNRAIDHLLQAGVPAPPFARELLLSGLKHPRTGRPKKIQHPERIVRAVWYRLLHGAGNCNIEGNNEAHRLVAAKFGISTALVTKIWKDTPREQREQIRAALLADMANPLFAAAFLEQSPP